MKIKDRIKELRRVKSSDLAPNPKNWRTHPESQKDAIRGILAEIGFAGAVLARELPDKTLMLIDGHARAEVVGDSKIPVLILDVTEEEADKILTTYDPIGAMAEADAEKLGKLLQEFDTSNQALKELMDGFAEKISTLEEGHSSEEISDQYTSKIKSPIYEPKGDKPSIESLFDRGKTESLIKEIESSGIPKDIAAFLILASERHTSFHFARIAEFYCHADPKVQDLMERNGLVIIDYDKAIEYGFVHMTERLGKIADKEEGESCSDEG